MSVEVPGTEGVAALGLDPDLALEAGRAATGSGRARSVAVHIAAEGDPYRSLVRATGAVGPLAEMLGPAAQLGLYRTATRDCRRHRFGWEGGEPTPGIGTIYGVKRAPTLTAAEFHDHWATTHRPLALRHHIGMWDYRQVSVVGPLAEGSADYDGFAIVQFPNRADMETRFFDGDEGRRVIRDDASRFTDGRASHMVLMREHRLLEEAPPAEPGWLTAYRCRELGVAADDAWTQLAEGAAQASGHDVVESRPGDRMLVLAVVDGLPPGIEQYSCRIEVRETGPDACRLDWQPTALVHGASARVLDVYVERSWVGLSGELGAAVGEPAVD